MTAFTNLNNQIRLGYFVDAVTVQVIERNLLRNLESDILSPLKVNDMNDKLIAELAADGESIKQNRQRLLGNLKILEDGQKAFRFVEN